MHKKELVELVADLIDLPQEKTQTVIDAVLNEITRALTRDETVSLVGFGSFSRRYRAARTGRSPSTGEALPIPASHGVVFKPGKGLKESLNSQ